MTVDEQQSVMRMLVSHIKVRRQLKGGNKFDPSRVPFVWVFGAPGKPWALPTVANLMWSGSCTSGTKEPLREPLGGTPTE